MNYLKIIIIIMLILVLFSGCRTKNKEDSHGEPGINNVKDEKDVIEDTEEEEMSGDSDTVEDTDENEATGEEASIEESEDDYNIEDEEKSDISTGEQAGSDSIQEQIDDLIEDIKEGNVIPDDHE